MLDDAAPPRLVAQAAPGLPVARLVAGRSVEEVLALMPRLFNLCRAAQGAALAAALGREVDSGGIAAEVRRDHLLKLQVSWPGQFGLAPLPLPEGWQQGGRALLAALFGPAGRAPERLAELDAFIASDRPAARALYRIGSCFAPGEAVAEGLAVVDAASVWRDAPVENSVAARHMHHPALAALAAREGRGPLWRACARLYDLEAAALGRLPAVLQGAGWAMVPAARGAYAVRVTVAAGQVTALERRTPTDALLAQGGVLARSLATLPPERSGLGPLLLDILDPCCPLRLKEVQHA